MGLHGPILKRDINTCLGQQVINVAILGRVEHLNGCEFRRLNFS